MAYIATDPMLWHPTFPKYAFMMSHILCQMNLIRVMLKSLTSTSFYSENILIFSLLLSSSLRYMVCARRWVVVMSYSEISTRACTKRRMESPSSLTDFVKMSSITAGLMFPCTT